MIEPGDSRQGIGRRSDGHGVGFGQEMDHPTRLTARP